MGDKKTDQYNMDAYETPEAEIIVIEEGGNSGNKSRDDVTAKCIALDADLILPKPGLETKLVMEMFDVRGNEAGKRIRNQIMMLLRKGGSEDAIAYINELRAEIDMCFEEGKADKLLQILSQADLTKLGG